MPEPSSPEEPVDPDAPIYEEPVTREARFVIEPVSGGKRLQAGSLVFDDGEEWIVSYRPLRRHLKFSDKRVKVHGRAYHSPPHVQSVMATHFEIETIELAPGETPYDPEPTELPAPPQVRAAADLKDRSDRWVHCVGTLASVDPPTDDSPYWQNGKLTFEDGGEVPLIGIPKSEAREAPVGEVVTVLGKVLGGREGRAIELAARRICPGVVERCRMTMDNLRD